MGRSTTITVFIGSDIGTVQGSTEPHYILQGLAEEYELHLFSPTDPDINGVTHHQLPEGGPIPALVWFNILTLPLFLYHAAVVRPDLVYTYKGFTLTPWFIKAIFDVAWIGDFRTEPTGQAREFEIVTGQHSRLKALYYDIYDLSYQLTLRRADAIIALSEELAYCLSDEYAVPCDRIKLVPLAVDTEQFDPARFPSENTNAIECVYLGSIARFRGIDLCFEAVEALDCHDDIMIHIVGDGPAEDVSKLERKAASCGINDAVIWHGYVDHSNVPEVLAGMDVALSPLPAHESFLVMSPAKVYEYLAMGLPVICSNLPAHRRLIEDGRTGFFFEPGDVNGLKRQFHRLRQLTEDDWNRLSRNAREVALKNDWSERVASIDALVQKCLDRQTVRHP